MALILLLQKTQLDFLHRGMEGDGTLEGNILKVTSPIKLPMMILPAIESSGHPCSYGTPAPLLPATGGDAADPYRQ